MTGTNAPDDKHKDSASKKKRLRRMLSGGGILCIVLGVVFQIAPGSLSALPGQLDREITTMLGFVFLLIGVSDIFIAQTIFKGNAKHD